MGKDLLAAIAVEAELDEGVVLIFVHEKDTLIIVIGCFSDGDISS